MKRLALCLLLWVVLPGRAVAEEPPAREIVVGVLQDWPPHYLQDARGQPTGFAVQVFDAVAAVARLRPTYRVYPDFPALLEALERGEVDVIPNLGVTDARSESFAFTSPVETTAIVVFVRVASIGINGLDSLAGKRVGVVESNVGVDLVSHHPAVLAVPFASPKEALFRLLAGEIDALVYPAPPVWTLARSAGIANLIKEAGSPLTEIKRSMAVLAGREDLRRVLDTAVQDYVATSAYHDVYARWHGRPEPFWTVKRVLGATLVLLVATIIVMGAWRYRTIRRLNHRLRFQAELIDNIAVAAIAVDLDGRIIAWNRFAEQLYGWTATEAMGRPVNEVTVPEESRGTAEAIMEKLKDGRIWSGEFEVRRRDGSRFPAAVTNAPIIDGAGKLIGCVGVSFDISERRALESQLHQAQRMEAIGRLAGGIAHDFNNLLTTIMGHTELLLMKVGADSPVRQDLGIIEKQAQRAASLTRQLLAFSRRQVLQPAVLDLGAVVREEATLLRSVIGEDVVLEVETASEALVFADPGQIHQVILNLAINARDAMPKGGTLSIAVDRVDIDELAARATPPLPAGVYVRLKVKDSGTGIPEEHLDHVFEPFFTTKPAGQGTGLGLATAYGVVKQSGGYIFLESRPGEGATFTILLPPVMNEPATVAAPSPRRSVQGGHETILVVEDEPSVRAFIRRCLAEWGYEVIDAERGDTALAKLRERDQSIDLVISDVVMPGMSGLELISRLREQRKDLKVLLISGHSTEMIARHGVHEAGVAFIHKPFGPDLLAQRVREILDDHPRPVA